MAKKRYQVFVSSTYEDLVEERREVMQALLESGCIPAGMELFPAADDGAWTLIKRVIDESDYYLLILAGRYGSIHSDGVGYTEMEYRYALEIGKPIVSFLIRDIQKLPVRKTDQDQKKLERLAAFQVLAKEKLVRYWETPAELGGLVSRSIEVLKEMKPAIGWIRGNLPGSAASTEADMLREELRKLKWDIKYTSLERYVRPDVLIGSTYKIKSPLYEKNFYVTVNDMVIKDDQGREYRCPYEVIINSEDATDIQWIRAVSQFISMCLRKGVEIKAIVHEMKTVHDPKGGYYKAGGVYVYSLVAEVGMVIESHCDELVNKSNI